MAAQADGLLIHGGLVAKDGGLGQDTGIIDVPVLQNDLELFVQAVGVVLHPTGAQGLHPAHAFFQKAQAVLHVSLHLGTLSGAHLHKAVQCLGGDSGDILPKLLLIHIGVAGGQHIGKTGDHPGGHIVLDLQRLRQVPQGLPVALGQLLIHSHHGIGGIHGLHRQAQFYLAAGHPLVQLLFQAAVQIAAGAGHPGRILKVPGIDAAQLHRDLTAIAHSSSPAKTGHAQNHAFFLVFQRVFCGHSSYMYPLWGTQTHVTIHILYILLCRPFFCK